MVFLPKATLFATVKLASILVEAENDASVAKDVLPLTVKFLAISTFSLKDASDRARISADGPKVTLLSNIVSWV